MTELKEFKLPDVGEGLTEADIVAWHVKPGDQVEVNQIIVEIETAKAVVELPSPWDGTVAHLLASEGQTVGVGTPIIAVDVSGTAPAAAADYAERSVVPAPATAPAQADQAERQPVLVGYGVKASSTTRRTRKAASPAAAAARPAPPAASAAPAAETGRPNTGEPSSAAACPGRPTPRNYPVREPVRHRLPAVHLVAGHGLGQAACRMRSMKGSARSGPSSVVPPPRMAATASPRARAGSGGTEAIRQPTLRSGRTSTARRR